MLDPLAGDPQTEVKPRARGPRRRARGALLAIIAVLYAASIPWYRPTDASVTLIFGLPDWVAVAIGCYVGVALLNAAAWLLTDVRDETPGGEVGGR